MALRKRLEYVDGLRGVAVVAMFFVHAVVAWLSPELRDGTYWARSMAVSGVVAPTFLFLVGLSISMVAEREGAAGVDPRASKRRIFKRGLEILAIGYGLHFTFYALDGFEGSWTRVLKVDVLHCIGLSMMLFSRLAWPSAKANWRAGAAFFLLPVLAWLAYRLPLEHSLPGGLSAYVTTKASLALFPFVPYAAWVALGLFIAPWWLAATGEPKRETRFGLGLASAGVLFLIGGKALGRLFYAWDLDTLGLDESIEAGQTKGLSHLFLIKGAYVFFLFSLALFTRRLWRARAARPLLLFGRESLVAYCAHLIVIYPLAGPYLSQRLMPLPQAALTLLLTASMYGLVVLYGRRAVVSSWRERLRMPEHWSPGSAEEDAQGASEAP